MIRFTTAMTCVVALAACGGETGPASSSKPAPRPAILLVTLDTTRADSIGPDASGIRTPAFNALAASGRLFEHAYATAPETLPAHSSMMTGLYPAAHGVHENARTLSQRHPLVADQLREAGYRTAAFVSAYPLDAQFGIARGFDVYDDELEEGQSERSSRETTDRAIRWIEATPGAPVFLWVHYFDPHYPYAPAEPFATEYASSPYLGEVAAMDRELGRLVDSFRGSFGPDAAIIVAGDHGEALGEHGESQHGNLLYQGVMRVPLVISGPGVTPGRSTTPVSTRRIFHTIRSWAGIDSALSLTLADQEVVLGEAMRPFLSFGWQPQVMAIQGTTKVIHAGTIEAYDIAVDPGETSDLGSSARISREIRQALRDYPIPSLAEAPSPESLTPEQRRQLASLGYVGAEARPVVRADAPRPRDMTHLFDELDRASGLFVHQEFAAAIPLLERIVSADPGNLMSVLRLAAAHSALGNEEEALEAFGRARDIAPESSDVTHYLGMHHLRTGDVERAAPLLERSVSMSPDRLPALEGLATVREKQGRLADALALRQRMAAVRAPSPAELARMGSLAMVTGNTPVAIESFERLRTTSPQTFRHDLELGVLYLEARRFSEARTFLDRVTRDHPRYPIALFKRAQVSVLLNEADQRQRIAAALAGADDSTRALIERERLFRGKLP